MFSSSFSTPKLLAFQRSVKKGLVLCLNPLGCELGAAINGILVFGAGWEPQVLTPKYCSIVLAPNLPVEPPGAVWERTENVGFCSSVTFSGVRSCVCSPCVTAQGSGSTGPPQGIQLLPEVGNVWELPLLPSASGWALWGAALGWLPRGEKCAWSPSSRQEALPKFME